MILKISSILRIPAWQTR